MTNNSKIAIVTGSSKGIGKAIATKLLEENYRVVVTSRNEDEAISIASKLEESTGGSAIGLGFDLEKPLAPRKLIDGTLDHFGRIDVLINNALSTSINVDPLTCDDADIDQGISANISGIIKLCRHAYPHLKETKGNIVNVSSSITKRYVLGLPLYAASKAALEKLTEVFAAEWAQDGIRINAICPGFTQSDAMKGLGLSEEQAKTANEHFNQFQILGSALPEHISPLVCYLISNNASMVTGSIFDIDGGHHIQGHPLFPESLFAERKCLKP